MKNTLGWIKTVAAMLAVCTLQVSGADRVTKARLGDLRRDDRVVVDVDGVGGDVVTSVNGQTGTVNLVAADVGAATMQDVADFVATNVTEFVSNTASRVSANERDIGYLKQFKSEAEAFDDYLHRTTTSIWLTVSTYVPWLANYATNNYTAAHIANVRAWNLEAWQHTNAISRADMARGVTEWAVVPRWPLGRVVVGQIESGLGAGMWSLFPADSADRTIDSILVTPVVAAGEADDVMSLSWPGVSLDVPASYTNDLDASGIQWVPAGPSNVTARFSVQATRMRLPTADGVSRLAEWAGSVSNRLLLADEPADSLKPSEYFTTNNSQLVTAVSDVTRNHITYIGDGAVPHFGTYLAARDVSVASTNATGEVATNSYKTVSLYSDGQKVWTSDPLDESNRGWLVALVLALVGSAGSVLWRYVAKAGAKFDSEAVAPDFDPGATYARGEFVTCAGRLYECLVAVEAPVQEGGANASPGDDLYDEAAGTGHWTERTVSEVTGTTVSALRGIDQALDDIISGKVTLTPPAESDSTVPGETQEGNP